MVPGAAEAAPAREGTDNYSRERAAYNFIPRGVGGAAGTRRRPRAPSFPVAPGIVIPQRAPQGAPAAAAPCSPRASAVTRPLPPPAATARMPAQQRPLKRCICHLPARPDAPPALPCPARPAGASGSGTGTPGRRRPRQPAPQHLVQAVDFLGGIDHFATAGALGIHFAAPLGRRLRRAAAAEVAVRRAALDGAAGG